MTIDHLEPQNDIFLSPVSGFHDNSEADVFVNDNDRIVDMIEYRRAGGAAFLSIAGVYYDQIVEHAATGRICFVGRLLPDPRRIYIDIAQIKAVTLDGIRHVLQVPAYRRRARGVELLQLLDGINLKKPVGETDTQLLP